MEKLFMGAGLGGLLSILLNFWGLPWRPAIAIPALLGLLISLALGALRGKVAD